MKPIRPSPFRRSFARRLSGLPRARASGWWLGGLLASLALATACKSRKTSPPATTEALATETPAESAGAQQAPKKSGAEGPLGNPTPVGPPLEVLPGRGIGPIRFGATFETVERHMTNPCDVRTETKCIYVNQAVEFTMQEGVVARIHVHRRDRPVSAGAKGQPHYFGSYFGGLRPEIVLGVHRHIVLGEVRPAERVEKVEGENPYGTVERHHYPGLVLEFDRLSNGNVVLGGFQVLRAPDAQSPALSVEELEAKRGAGDAPAAPAPR